MSDPRKWVTMGDVARAAGVGKITVSRALRTPAKVSPDTLAKVHKAVDALGYVRDETAGALSSQRSRVVGALVSTLDRPVFATTIRGLEEGLSAGGLQLLLGSTRYAPDKEARMVSTLLGRRPDALVLTSTDHTPQTRRLLENAGLPVIELWELPDDPIFAAVGFSNRAAGRDMTRHLIGSGRKHPVFLRVANANDTRADLREAGYRGALEGFEPRILSLPPDDALSGPDFGAQGLAQALARWPDTDAVICVSDALAVGAWCEAMRRGLDVPGLLAITGFGDIDVAGDAGLALTTIRIDGEAIGREAARLTLAATAGEPLADRIIDLGYTLVRRATG
ncbi:LacI family DNA-binding transcriptional regulator [Antarctobacter heliothermus]|uniref:Transcriptional regulator, LacI family n=1 Tax=Antarctobacter heliothermus TaxID=74033 RepID=A0A239CPZ7_9RHOB|nr:LacI family DNA-binding transcriptional regulator [Antarctobacter heliothermus]SNS22210.1 transcriptional regulator, LacI family [Antarctobacter heliothermus]